MTAKNDVACSPAPSPTPAAYACPQHSRADRIRALNDHLRTTGQGGRVQITRGIVELGPDFAHAVLARVIGFDAFTEDNDPFGEHDCASLKVMDQNILWKIDYYDRSLTFNSPDPTDPKVTVRVLTIMLASEY